MKKFFTNLNDVTPVWYKLLLLFNAVLVSVSFLMPPRGVIDPSVLAAIGEIGGFALIGLIPYFLKHGATVKVKKGSSEIQVQKSDEPSVTIE